jgi:quercetin dioxygenase-like cupin family protein
MHLINNIHFRNNNPHFRVWGEKTVQHTILPKKYEFLGLEMNIHLTGEQSFGGYSMVEISMPAGKESFEHLHATEDETVHVLDGELTVTCNGHATTLTVGQTLFIPRNTVHSLQNLSSGTVRTLQYYTSSKFTDLVIKAGIALDASPPSADHVAFDQSRLPHYSKRMGTIYLSGPATTY